MEALGSFLASRSGIREVWEGFGNEVGKRDVPGGAAGLPGPETQGGGSIMGGKSGHGEDNRRGRRDQITSPTPVDPKGVGGLYRLYPFLFLFIFM